VTEQPRRRGVAVALALTIIVLAAFLTTILTLPLLSKSIVTFAVVAGCCWAAIFTAAFFVSRSLGSASAANRSAGGEPLAERPERVLDDPLPDHVRLEGVAGSDARVQERLY
jgi:small-conductance mechanosensitive channel